jgi:hypothetical protein
MSNPEIARSVRTGGFDTNVHDMGVGAPVQNEQNARFVRLVRDFLDEGL